MPDTPIKLLHFLVKPRYTQGRRNTTTSTIATQEEAEVFELDRNMCWPLLLYSFLFLPSSSAAAIKRSAWQLQRRKGVIKRVINNYYDYNCTTTTAMGLLKRGAVLESGAVSRLDC